MYDIDAWQGIIQQTLKKQCFLHMLSYDSTIPIFLLV